MFRLFRQRPIIEYVGPSVAFTNPEQWKKSGINGALIVLANPAKVLYDPKTSFTILNEEIKTYRNALGPKKRIYLGFWSGNELPGVSLEKSHLYPWDDNEGWRVFTENLELLSLACHANKVYGVLMDAEVYTSNTKNSPGYMNPTIAWPAGTQINLRAQQYVKALRSHSPNLVLGHYVYWGTVRDLDGWLPWVIAFRKAAGKKIELFLEDTYWIVYESDFNIQQAAYYHGHNIYYGYLWKTSKLSILYRKELQRRLRVGNGAWTLWDGQELDPSQQHEPFAIPGMLDTLSKAHKGI